MSSMRPADRKFFISILVFLVAISFGVIGYLVAGWTVLDAMYMVVITIFGVGYGEVHDLSPELRIFTVAFIVVGCTSLLYATGAFINWLTEGQLQTLLGKRKMEKELRNLNNHVIICGFGRVGKLLSTKLFENKRPFVVIDRSEEKIREIQDDGYLAIMGDSTEEEVLKKARIEHASVIATVLPDDAANVFIVLSGRSINPSLTIISRADNSSTQQKLFQAGADKIVMPAVIGADHIANMVLKPNAQEILEKDLHDNYFLDNLNDIGLEIGEIEVVKNSPLDGGVLEDLEKRGRSAFLVVAVRKKNGNTIIKPPLDQALHAGDKLIVISQKGVKLNFNL
jgi:voltage-gated potassium channel